MVAAAGAVGGVDVPDEAGEQIWVRQGDAVKGPFPRERVEASIEAGSLGDDMAYSLDGELWVPGEQCRALFPGARSKLPFPGSVVWLIVLGLLHAALCIGSAFWLWHIVPESRASAEAQWEEWPGRFGWTPEAVAEQRLVFDQLLVYGWLCLAMGILSLLMALVIACRGRAVRMAQYAVSGIAIAFAIYGAVRHGVDVLVLKGAGLQAALLWTLWRPGVRAHHLAAALTKPRR